MKKKYAQLASLQQGKNQDWNTLYCLEKDVMARDLMYFILK